MSFQLKNNPISLFCKGLHEVVERLEASMIEKSLVIQIHEDSVKKLHENIILLRGDSAHWERKSVSASKELLRLSNLEHFHAIEDNVDLLEKNSALKTKLKVILQTSICIT